MVSLKKVLSKENIKSLAMFVYIDYQPIFSETLMYTQFIKAGLYNLHNKVFLSTSLLFFLLL